MTAKIKKPAPKLKPKAAKPVMGWMFKSASLGLVGRSYSRRQDMRHRVPMHEGKPVCDVTVARVKIVEAREKQMREALVRIDALDPDVPDACTADALRGLVMRMGEIARNALAGGKQ